MAPRGTRKDPVKTSSKISPPKRQKRKPSLPAKSKAAGGVKKVKKQPTVVATAIKRRHDRGAGGLLVMGMNEAGQLGLGEDIPEAKRPRVLDLSEDIVDVASGGMHTLVLTNSGEVFTFGCNDEGALGRPGDTGEEEAKPMKVEGFNKKVVQISAGDSHSAALLEDGQVFVWGSFRDSNNQLGLRTSTIKEIAPVPLVLNGVKVTKIASGQDHLVCLSDQGQLYTCGNGEQGQLGRVSVYCSSRGGRRGVGRFLSPDIVRVKRRGRGYIQFEDCWTGQYWTFAKAKDNGDIFAFGLNNYNQLGIAREEGKHETNLAIYMPTKVAALSGKNWVCMKGGPTHTLALDADGKAYSFGRNDYGQCGTGATGSEPVQVQPVDSLKNIKSLEVSTGSNVSYSLDNTGKVWVWGQAGSCQLGSIEDDEDYPDPTVLKGKNIDSKHVLTLCAGGQHTCFIIRR